MKWVALISSFPVEMFEQLRIAISAKDPVQQIVAALLNPDSFKNKNYLNSTQLHQIY
jgi:hypothetical protein